MKESLALREHCLGCSDVDGSFSLQGEREILFLLQVSPRGSDAVPPRRNGREVAAGVKSKRVRKGDRGGKLAKTARELSARASGIP